jgi:hypothetical protein
MLRVILVLAAIGVTIYALVDCLRSDSAQLKGLPKAVWILAILLLAPFGAIIWLVVRRQSSGGPPTRPAPRVVAPDDDPDFLRKLEQERRRREGKKDGKHRAEGTDPEPS